MPCIAVTRPAEWARLFKVRRRGRQRSSHWKEMSGHRGGRPRGTSCGSSCGSIDLLGSPGWLKTTRQAVFDLTICTTHHAFPRLGKNEKTLTVGMQAHLAHASDGSRSPTGLLTDHPHSARLGKVSSQWVRNIPYLDELDAI